MQRSIYTLREADAHSWAIPRLTGRAKAALMEIQADEYGGGDVDRMHQELFTRTLLHAGLDATHGAYVDRVPAITLAEDEPELLGDILFGAAACLTVDGWAGDHILQAWEAGRSSLRGAVGVRS